MADVTIHFTAFETAILGRLQNRFPDTNVNEFIRDRLFTALVSRLNLGLGDVVQAEQQFIAAGKATACGSTYVVTTGTQPFTYTCVRINDHQTNGIMARPTHMAPGPDSQLTTWQEGQTAGT